MHKQLQILQLKVIQQCNYQSGSGYPPISPDSGCGGGGGTTNKVSMVPRKKLKAYK